MELCMDWTQSLQIAIDYIEKHLTEKLDFEIISSQAGFSSFYFQRIFNAICGISIGEYIRYRRLTLAGIDLKITNEKIINIALKYGYDSPESFTRAFSKFHGISPSAARKTNCKLNSFSKLTVEINLKGGIEMDYKIINKEAFFVLEKVSSQSIDDTQDKNTIPAFWEESHKNGTIQKLLELTSDRTNIFGICYGNTLTNKQSFDYSVAALCDKNTNKPSGFRINKIPARTWAVFDCKGPMPDAMQETFHRICTEFFPASDYQPTYEMDIEAYPAGNMVSDDYKSEIWITVKKKA